MNRLRTIAVNLCRFLLAVTFVLSGFVKAVDPMGTAYKIGDYLEAMALREYVPSVLEVTVSVLLSALEFGLGVCLLFAIRRRLASKLTLLLMVALTALTLWVAVADPVTDCGCFGDAVKLTNWQTFWKNVVLLVAAGAVAMRPALMARMVSESNQWIVVNYAAVFIFAVSGYSLYDRPLFDFRPYHTGADIRKGMEIPEGAEQPRFATTFVLEKDGERKTFTLDDYPDSTWTFIDSKTVKVSEGYVPPITDFSIVRTDDGEDITQEVLDRKGYTFLLTAPHLETADDSRLDLINLIYEYAEEQGVPFYCLTASSEKGIRHWRESTGAEYPFFNTDEITLKTMIRSNPGLLLLKDGVVYRKWSCNMLPSEEMLQGDINQAEIGTRETDATPEKIAGIISWFVLPLVLLTLADRLWAWTKWFRKRRSNKIYQHLYQRNLNKSNNEKENRSRQLEDEPEPARGHRPGKRTE